MALRTAVTGTVVIGAGAFWLSFTALTDLAQRSGIDAGQAWAWPLIVDGIIVVTTVAVVAMSRRGQPAWYPWMLLLGGAAVSVIANALHAGLTDIDVPVALAAPVAAVPPLVLVAVTHLTVVLARPVPDGAHRPNIGAAPVPVAHAGRDAATRLHRQGWSNKSIAGRLGVHPSTVGRWLSQAGTVDELEPSHAPSNGRPAITGLVDGQAQR